MKKKLLFIATFIISLFLTQNIQAQSPNISSFTPTDPLCFGAITGGVVGNVTQGTPVDSVEIKLFWLNPNTGGWVNLGTSIGTVFSFNFPNLLAGDYRFDLNFHPSGAFIEDASFTLVDPPQLNSSIVSVSNPSTPISNDGFINTAVSGGTPVYTYFWSNTATTQNLTGLNIGSYSFTVTDNNGCTSTSDTTLTAINSCSTGTVIVDSVTCYAALDGVINISGIFGASPYTISIKDTSAGNTNLDTTFTSSSLSPGPFTGCVGPGCYAIGKGVYEYTLTDNTGCSSSVFFSIGRDGDRIQVIDTIISLVTDTLAGTINADGSFILNNVLGGYPNGVTPPFNFTWYDVNDSILQDSSLNTLSSVDTGAYYVVIADNGVNGCVSDTIFLQMSVAPPCRYELISVTDNNCPGASEGQVIFDIGSGWLAYVLTDSQDDTISGSLNQNTIDSLFSGSYNLILQELPGSDCDGDAPFDTDDGSGLDTLNFDILEPIIDSIYRVDASNTGGVLCPNDSSRVFVELTLPPSTLNSYEYRVESLGGGSFLTGDLVGDTSSRYYFPNINYELLLLYNTSFSSIANSCELSYGNYLSEPFTIDDHELTIDSVNITDAICGVSPGELNVYVTGDNGNPFSYVLNYWSDSTLFDQINNIATTQDFTSYPDTFLVSVTDDIGCEVNWYTPVVVGNVVNVKLDPNLEIIKKETCYENDGYLEVTAFGGIGDYDFILTKFNDTTVISQFDVASTFICDTLDEGTYFLSVSDDSSCVYLDTFVIEHVVPFEISSLDKIQETCCGNDGSIAVNIVPVNGASAFDGDTLWYTLRFDTSAINALGFPLVGIPQTYIDTFNLNQENDSLFSNLTRGYYHIYVQDELGCVDSVDYTSYYFDPTAINTSLEIDASMSLDMSFSTTDVICYEDTNATVKLLYPNVCYSYELLLYHDTAATELIATDSIGVLDTMVYYNGLHIGIYGIKGLSYSNYPGCVRKSDTFEIFQPTIVSFDDPDSSAAFCLNGGFAVNGGSCNGMLWLPNSPTGGVPDTSIIQGDTLYQYYINRVNSSTSYFQGPILTTDTFSGLCPGEYEVQVFDGNNCMVKKTVEIADSSLYIDDLVITNISCFDSSDATISVYSHGGVGDYNYVWTDSMGVVFSDTTYILDSLLAGEYFVTVYDSVNCYAIDSAIILPAPDSLAIISRRNDFDLDETCLGATFDGRVGFEIRGGTSPYVYEWFNSDTSSTGIDTTSAIYCDTCISTWDGEIIDSIHMLYGLTSDTYRFILTDINDCPASTWFPIDSFRIIAANRNNPLSIDSITGLQDILCYGSVSDSVIIYMNDAAMWPLMFELDSGSNALSNYTGIFSSLGANDYNILIIDSFGCELDSSLTVLDHSEIILNASIDSLSCFESNDGSISLQVSGGTPGYTYLWDGPNGFSSFDTLITSLDPGHYSVTVTDTNNCITTDTMYVGEPSPLQSTITNIQDADCNKFETASASISLYQTGTPPYTYQWSDASGTISGATSSTLDGVSAGVYLCTILDANGCEDTISVILNEPTPVVIQSIDTTGNPCNGDTLGEIIVIASGGTPGYSNYTIKDSNGDEDLGLNGVFSNLPSDEYDLWVYDAKGCASNVIQLEIKEPGLLDLVSDLSQDLSCFESDDGKIKINIIGGNPPYDYQDFVRGISGVIALQGGHIELDYLNAGDYYIEVQDYNQCQDSILITLSQPDEVVSNFEVINPATGVSEDLILKNDRIDVMNLSTGASIYTWNFDDGTGDILEYETSHKYTQQGTFSISLVAEYYNDQLEVSCYDTSWKYIEVEGYDIYNVFTPNGDGINDLYKFSDEALTSLSVDIYNRWGQQVFSFNDINGFWDGKGYNGELLPEGVYFFSMEAVGELGTSYVEEGTITLIR